jgi:hypothetical protein
MGRAVVGATVGLDLDDPPLASTPGVLADQACAEERPGGLRDRAGQRRSVDDAQEGALG